MFDERGGAFAKQACHAFAACSACCSLSSVKLIKSGWSLNTTSKPVTHVACNSNLYLDPINLLALLQSATQPQLTQQ